MTTSKAFERWNTLSLRFLQANTWRRRRRLYKQLVVVAAVIRDDEHVLDIVKQNLQTRLDQYRCRL